MRHKIWPSHSYIHFKRESYQLLYEKGMQGKHYHLGKVEFSLKTRSERRRVLYFSNEFHSTRWKGVDRRGSSSWYGRVEK